MNQEKYKSIIELVNQGAGFLPVNQNAHDLLNRTAKGEILQFQEITPRDLNFHKCYFSLIGYIYDILPEKFTNRISKDKFYIFLKHISHEYKVIHTFKDGSQMIEYTSIAFGKMSQKKFEEYIANQLPVIYSNVLGAFFEIDILNMWVDNIENEFKRLIRQLP